MGSIVPIIYVIYGTYYVDAEVHMHNMDVLHLLQSTVWIGDKISIKILELTRWKNTLYWLSTVFNTLRSGVRFHTTVELLIGILKG